MPEDLFIDIVDENDSVIGRIKEEEALSMPDKRTRAISIFLFNSKRELLLQRRSKNKIRYPLHWDCSASGFVNSGEDYETTAVRELKEELGVIKKTSELEFILKRVVETDRTEFVKLYKLEYDGPIKVNDNEVESGKFFSINEIKEMIDSGEKLSPFFVILFNSVYK
ncbi:MAG: NUDIX domain-containing protein [Candidatus Nealsonbacteria bacterium]|nr:NUDIX domain-containing protein [Candidatus Nealsonbacteria bacterium]